MGWSITSVTERLYAAYFTRVLIFTANISEFGEVGTLAQSVLAQFGPTRCVLPRAPTAHLAGTPYINEV